MKRYKIVGNTYEFENEIGDRIIQFYDTEIVTFKKNGDIVLNSGGYRTPTTKERMNSVLKDYYIEQSNNIWYIHRRITKETVPFYDGIVLKVGKPLPNNTKIEDKTKVIVAKINKFVNKLDKMKEIPIPSNGDCWYCAMWTEDGKTLGEVTKDNNHLLSHMKEGYVHGSLIYNALKESGYQFPEYHWQMHCRDNIKNALRRYLKTRLLPK